CPAPALHGEPWSPRSFGVGRASRRRWDALARSPPGDVGSRRAALRTSSGDRRAMRAGAGHGPPPAPRPHRSPRASLALGAVEEVLKFLLRLGQDRGRRRALDALLDGHADDVAVLGDADDLRQTLAADLERGLVGLVP